MNASMPSATSAFARLFLLCTNSETGSGEAVLRKGKPDERKLLMEHD
jgi:hypothetical protein